MCIHARACVFVGMHIFLTFCIFIGGTNLTVRILYKKLSNLKNNSIFQLSEFLVQLVVQLATYLNHVSLNLGVGLPERCFIYHFSSLPLGVAQPSQKWR